MLGIDSLTAAGSTAIAVPFLIQVLKNSPYFPWIDRQTQRVNFAVGVLSSGLSAAGIHFAYDHAAASIGITISLHMLYSWFVQWSGQQVVYKGFVVPAEALGEIRAVLKEALLAQRPEQKGTDIKP